MNPIPPRNGAQPRNAVAYLDRKTSVAPIADERGRASQFHLKQVGCAFGNFLQQHYDDRIPKEMAAEIVKQADLIESDATSSVVHDIGAAMGVDPLPALRHLIRCIDVWMDPIVEQATGEKSARQSSAMTVAVDALQYVATECSSQLPREFSRQVIERLALLKTTNELGDTQHYLDTYLKFKDSVVEFRQSVTELQR